MTISKNDWMTTFQTLTKERNHKLLHVDFKNGKSSILKIECNYCNSSFQVLSGNYIRAGQGKKTTRNSIVDEQGKISHFFPHCCPTCKRTYRKNNIVRPIGENHPNWKGGVNPSREGYMKKEYRIWKETIHKAGNGQCFLTGKKSATDLEAHHLYSFQKYAELRYDPANGILLHKEVHKKFHQIYGPITTRQDFENFAYNYYGIKEFPWQNELKFQQCADLTKSTVVTNQEKRSLAFFDTVKVRGYEIRNGTYENKNSRFQLYCPRHNYLYETTPHLIQKSKYGMPCCSSEASIKQIPPSRKGIPRSEEAKLLKKATDKKKYMAKLIEIAEERGHKVVSGTFENKNSVFTIFCSIHNQKFSVSYFNYCRAKLGLSCCIDSHYLKNQNSRSENASNNKKF